VFARRDSGEVANGKTAHSHGESPEIETLCRRRLRRRSPLEQMSVRDAKPPQRPHDGVAHQPGLIRQKSNIQR
jgi:hypothetical protein